MRILMLHEDPRNPNLDGQGGGAESLREDTIKGLVDRGHEVARIGIEDFRDRPVAEVMDANTRGVDCVMVSTIHNFIGLDPLHWLQRNNVPHVVTLNDYYPFCGSRMLLHNGDRSCPAVCGQCDNSCGNALDGRFVELINGSYHVTYNRVTAEIMRRHGLRVDDTVMLGVDTSLFKPDPDKRDAEVSVYTSSAWAAWPTKGMHVLKAAMEGRPWGANLITGIPRGTVAEVLKRAHIYVFPSCYEETWGLCLTEAMASGCACIATDTAGAREQIFPEHHGLLVPKRDPMAMRAAVERLLGDAKLREALGRNARIATVALFNLSCMAQRWEGVFEDAIEYARKREVTIGC